jgi:tight adherence protein C
MDLPILIAVLVFVATGCLALGVIALTERRRETQSFRGRVDGTLGHEEGEDPESGVAYFRDRVGSFLERLGRISGGSKDEGAKEGDDISTLRKTLVVAGYRKSSAPMMFMGVKLLLGIGLPVIALMVPSVTMSELPQTQRLFVYFGLAVAGVYLPELWLSQVSSKRKLKIIEGFPDALDLLVVCVEAGLGLDAAMDRAGIELGLVHPELCQEFAILTLELRAGLGRKAALENLGARVDIDEIRSFVALLVQTDRFGTSVGQALRVHSDAMRVQRSLRAEEKAAKLPVKMLFPLMFFIFPSLFIVILGPAIIQGVRILIPALAVT